MLTAPRSAFLPSLCIPWASRSHGIGQPVLASISCHRARAGGGRVSIAVYSAVSGHKAGFQYKSYASLPQNGTDANNTARQLHSTAQRPRPADAAMNAPGFEVPRSPFQDSHQPTPVPPSRPPHDDVSVPLSVLPLKTIVRSLAVTSISSSRLMLPPSLWIMSALANTQMRILSPDHNPLLRMFIKSTFYAQFCAGENHGEVRRTISDLKKVGFTGVVLGYAKEVVLSETEIRRLVSDGSTLNDVSSQVKPWLDGSMETVMLAQPGDFVALKFTGAGQQALAALASKSDAPREVAEALDSLCATAVSRGVRLLFDAEQALVQAGIDRWALQYMEKFNRALGRAVIYGTYQAYLKSTPATLTAHLEAARRGGFTLGVKLVRGAYLGSDPRELMHERKEDTDADYNEIAEGILTRQWNGCLAGSGSFPDVSLVLATHNAESVRLARQICDGQRAKSDVAFAQLQGMADEVSCGLLTCREPSLSGGRSSSEGSVADSLGSGSGTWEGKKPLQTYKYLVWGSTGDCMKYLLRRAHENRDAVQRTKNCRDAMWAELLRRISGGRWSRG